MIRQEDQGVVLGGVVHLDPAQPVRAVRRGGPARQLDDLVPQDGAALGHPAPLDHLVHGVALQAGDEEHLLGRQLPKPRVINVPAGHDDDGARVKAQGAGHSDVMPLALGDDDHAGQVAVVIQQAMQLDRPLGAPELGPVEERRAQIDHRGIQTDQLVLEPELPAPVALGLAPPEQLLEHGAVELPRPMFIGIGQRRAGRGRDAQVPELALAAAQPAADLPQRMGAPELAEQHGDELPPAGEAAGMALGVRPLHRGLELGARKHTPGGLTPSHR